MVFTGNLQPVEGIFHRVVRVVAQPGSAHVWGAWGRKFESCLPDLTAEALA